MADALLTVKYRATVRQLYYECDQEKQWSQGNQPQSGETDVVQSLREHGGCGPWPRLFFKPIRGPLSSIFDLRRFGWPYKYFYALLTHKPGLPSVLRSMPAPELSDTMIVFRTSQTRLICSGVRSG